MKTNYSQSNEQQTKKLIKEGKAKMESGEFLTAIEKYSEAIKLLPEDGLLFAYRGQAYAEAAKIAISQADQYAYYGAFFEDFEKAIKLNPDSIEVRSFCGLVYESKGMIDEAIDEFDAAMLLRDQCQFDKDQLDEAIQKIDKVITRIPDDPIAYTIRGFLNLHKCYSDASGSKKTFAEKSIADYTRSIELGSENTYNYVGIREALGLLDKHKEAIEKFNVIIEIDPTNSEAHYGRAHVYASLNEVQKAIEDFDKCIEMNPHDLSAFIHRARQHSKDLNYSQALRDIASALDLISNPDAAGYYISGTLSVVIMPGIGVESDGGYKFSFRP